ncbi:Serine/threonine-protein kinase PK-1 [Enhygromyxa salina]|uniref:Serine/threonine-protein kinase PK-1 n=1 Tax=Enhygromyxa salina TaxID=215803 RepID=A0A2S9YBI3_9BACT|nr:protein kinase [Enhygromyxa salina]PRQ02465.1 Serine/threonine-protein kinase PK-1 [Enhygromyxa salina]
MTTTLSPRLRVDPLLTNARVCAGPTRRNNELRWELELADGRAARLAQLAPELASDASVRRRYRRDIAHLAELAPEGVAELLAWGPVEGDEPELEPEPDASPWRLRVQVEGESLERWLDARAPASPDEVAEKLAPLCRLLAGLHAQGVVIRDLSPNKIVSDPSGRAWLVDVGLVRTDILSTRTAASLVLESSPYTAPEMLTRTAVDGRADLYALGVLMFRALTGELPFGDTHALLRAPDQPAPKPSSLRPGLSPALDELVTQLLAVNPGARPETAGLVADVLSGDASLPSHALAQMGCQSCGASMPVGQRLCLGCGKLAVQFEHAGSEVPPEQRRKLVLRKAKEDGAFVANLRELCTELAEGEVPALNFVIGDARMYSKAEQERMLRLPVTLFNDLDLGTAEALQQRFAARGVPVEIKPLDGTDSARGPAGLTRAQRLGLGISGGVGGAIALGLGVLVHPLAAAAVMLGLVVLGVLMMMGFRKTNQRRFLRWGRSLLCLRRGPAALPASDPLVARLATIVQAKPAKDVHELVSRLALLVQRMVDHRGENAGEAAEIELAVSTLEPLIGQVEARVRAIRELDDSLAELDEGRLVRALATCAARGADSQERERLLDGLDRLRVLEVERARCLASLAEACDLARRSVDMGLRVKDPEAEHARRVKMALLALE